MSKISLQIKKKLSALCHLCLVQQINWSLTFYSHVRIGAPCPLSSTVLVIFCASIWKNYLGQEQEHIKKTHSHRIFPFDEMRIALGKSLTTSEKLMKTIIVFPLLTHLFPVHPFPIRWKSYGLPMFQKTLRFADVSENLTFPNVFRE